MRLASSVSLAITVLAPFLTLAAAEASAINLRLMPLGASITFGVGSSDGNGYRKKLRDQLISADYSVDMVGSQLGNGAMEDNENEGYPGLVVAEVHAKARNTVPVYQPNMYLVNAGTNDCSRNIDLDNIGARMNALLGDLWAVTPNATVILSTLLINLDANTQTRVKYANQQYSALASRLAGEGRRIVLADMQGADGPLAGDMQDPTHPNDRGFQKMADIWFRCIQQAKAAGMIM